MALPPDLCPECGAERPRRAAGCPRCGRIFEDGPDAASRAVPSAAPAPRATAPEPHPDDARAEAGGGCRSCLLLAALCGGLTLCAAVVFWLLVRDDARTIVESGGRMLAEGDLGRLAEDLEAWADEHDGRLPDSLDELGGPRDARLDPWDRPYRYDPDPDRRSARLSSYGADNTPGGEGADADLERVVTLR